MVSIVLSLNGVGYNTTGHAIIGTATIGTANWGQDPGFQYKLWIECREGGESGVGVGGLAEKSGQIGPTNLIDSLDFHFFVDESKNHVVIATFMNENSGQVIRRVVKMVFAVLPPPPPPPPPPPNGPPIFPNIPIEYLVIGAGVIIVAIIMLLPTGKR